MCVLGGGGSRLKDSLLVLHLGRLFSPFHGLLLVKSTSLYPICALWADPVETRAHLESCRGAFFCDVKLSYAGDPTRFYRHISNAQTNTQVQEAETEIWQT